MYAKDKVIVKIFEDPIRKYHVRELARELKINPNSVTNAVKQLEKENIVIKKIRKHIVEITGNIDHPLFMERKRIFNLAEIYKFKIIDFLVKHYKPEAIILFGSYSKGEDVKESDIDLAIITEKKDIIDVEAFEKKLSRKIHVLPLQFKDITEDLYINLINGMVLNGYLNKK